jgi:hypothetical protein
MNISEYNPNIDEPIEEETDEASLDELYSPSDFQILMNNEELTEIETLMRNGDLSPADLPQDLVNEIRRVNGFI